MCSAVSVLYWNVRTTMVSKLQHLNKHSPSPSTVLYTVSDASTRATRLSRFTYRVTIFARLALAGACLLTLGFWGQEFGDCFTKQNVQINPVAAHAMQPSSSQSRLGRLASTSRDYFVPVRACTAESCVVGEDLKWLEAFLGTCTTAVISGKLSRGWIDWAPALMCIALLFWLSRRDHREEQLLVIRGLGIQTSSCANSYLSSPTTRFIPTSQIQDIFIHEAFIGFEVRFYLAVIVDGEEEAVVVFPKMLPKREILEEVWRGSKNVLYRGKKG